MWIEEKKEEQLELDISLPKEISPGRMILDALNSEEPNIQLDNLSRSYIDEASLTNDNVVDIKTKVNSTINMYCWCGTPVEWKRYKMCEECEIRARW